MSELLGDNEPVVPDKGAAGRSNPFLAVGRQRDVSRACVPAGAGPLVCKAEGVSHEEGRACRSDPGGEANRPTEPVLLTSVSPCRTIKHRGVGMVSRCFVF